MNREKLINLIPALEAWYDTIPAMCTAHTAKNRKKDAEDYISGKSDDYLVTLESNVTYAALHTPLAKKLEPEQSNELSLWYFIEKYLPKTDEVKARMAEAERLETIIAGPHDQADYDKWADLADGLFIDALEVFLDGLKKTV